MMERIRELSDNQIDSLKALGKDTLSALSPPIASMVYGNTPDQLQALQNIGPDALGAMSPQLADYIYGNDGYSGGAVGTYGDEDQYGGGAVGDYGDDDGDKKKRPPWIILPPFPFPKPPGGGGDDRGGGYQPDPGEYVSWNVDPSLNNCQPCLDNAADTPRPYGTSFSSGDTEPPIHKGCGCFLTSSMRGSCPIHGYRSRDRIFELSSRY